MRALNTIFEEAGGPSALARTIGEDINTVKAWKANGSIPSRFWKRIVTEGIATYEELATAAEVRGRRRSTARPRAA